MRKIKCVIKRPDEKYGHMTSISTTLKNLQNIVEGPIQVINVYPGTTDLYEMATLGPEITIILNEEGKLRGLEPNMKIPGDILVGTIIVIGSGAEDFTDIPITYGRWKRSVEAWERD